MGRAPQVIRAFHEGRHGSPLAEGTKCDSYFGLVQRLADAVPHIDVVKQSACIEGARMAFARVKTFWGKMKAIDVATNSPPKGKDRPEPEHYFGDVLEAARLIEGQCSKDITFE